MELGVWRMLIVQLCKVDQLSSHKQSDSVWHLSSLSSNTLKSVFVFQLTKLLVYQIHHKPWLFSLNPPPGMAETDLSFASKWRNKRHRVRGKAAGAYGVWVRVRNGPRLIVILRFCAYGVPPACDVHNFSNRWLNGQASLCPEWCFIMFYQMWNRKGACQHVLKWRWSGNISFLFIFLIFQEGGNHPHATPARPVAVWRCWRSSSSSWRCHVQREAELI